MEPHRYMIFNNKCGFCGCESGNPTYTGFNERYNAKMARDLKRDCILIELNPKYIGIAREKLRLNEQLVNA